MVHKMSPLAVPTESLEPYVLKAIADHSGHSLKTSDVLRVVDSYLVTAGEERYTSSQQVRVVLMRLADDPDTRIYKRAAGDPDDPAILREGMVAWLFSDTDPVPAWTLDYILQRVAPLPEPRLNPEHGRTGRRKSHVQPALPEQVAVADTGDRAELIVTLVRELAKDADKAADVSGFEREIAKLKAEKAALKEERDAVVAQLKAITRAQKTIQEILGSS